VAAQLAKLTPHRPATLSQLVHSSNNLRQQGVGWNTRRISVAPLLIGFACNAFWCVVEVGHGHLHHPGAASCSAGAVSCHAAIVASVLISLPDSIGSHPCHGKQLTKRPLRVAFRGFPIVLVNVVAKLGNGRLK
jgi:hypothetical protein